MGTDRQRQIVEVELGERSYPIVIGQGLLSDPEAAGALLRPAIRGEQVVLITNPTVQALYAGCVQAALPDLSVATFVMEDGEQHKNLSTYAQAMDFLMAQRMNRNVCVLALGGGVVGDLAGFVAATYQRGVDFVQIPTTLLSQVDSSVGGKTAVNHPAGKNMIGAFYQPRLVLIDTDTLNSLAAREYAAGLAEVVKYGVIADAEFFTWLEAHGDALVNRDAEALTHAIRRSCEIKAAVVARDEREGGLRAILNFGHTFGHAIEQLSGYGTWLHGEAVAIGMVMAARFSQQLGRVDATLPARLEALLVTLGLPVALTGAIDSDDVKQAMGMDKKAVGGRIRFVLADRLGQVSLVDEYDPEQLDLLLARSLPGQ